jgi:hypothetical protein
MKNIKQLITGEEDIPMYLLVDFGGELDKVTVSSESNSNYNHTR